MTKAHYGTKVMGTGSWLWREISVGRITTDYLFAGDGWGSGCVISSMITLLVHTLTPVPYVFHTNVYIPPSFIQARSW